MCGIVAAVSRRDVVPILLDGLRHLEYRGYDSAGIAVVQHEGLRRLRTAGRVNELAAQTARENLAGSVGIGHTRWATHGAPSERNAHPHISGGLALVHNGIIENHEALRERLRAAGYAFSSETDTEVIAHLVAHERKSRASLFEAVFGVLAELQGAFAIAVVSLDDPQTVVLARKGAPLVIGIGDGEYFAASDVSALVGVTRRVIYLEEGDCAELRPESVRIRDAAGTERARTVHVSHLSADAVELGQYRHYMEKEIHEQPAAVADTLDVVKGSHVLAPEVFGVEAAEAFAQASSVLIVACGTSYHAGLIARYWLEAIAQVPCNVEIASEYRYRRSVPDPNGLMVCISQSGETADTLAALEHARSLGYQRTLAICNVPESSLVRAARLRFLTRAGPEIGVASTKAFTTQLASLFIMTLALAKCRGVLSESAEAQHLKALRHLPAALSNALAVENDVRRWARHFATKQHALFLGRGIHYPIALEGALKLKEITYIHAEAYAAGELKHGPLALVDANMPIVAVAPNDLLIEKLKSNLQEVRARGGELFVIADRDSRLEADEMTHVIRLLDYAGALSPILHVLPLQLLAYHAAVVRGTDVDKPRNLAKSVTVE